MIAGDVATAAVLCEAKIDHEAVKHDDVMWRLLKYRGLQDAFDGGGTVLEMRNCVCGSTLCRPIAKEVA